MELPAGRVVIELAPQFAPHHVANVLALAREQLLRRPADRARAGQLRRAVGRPGRQEAGRRTRSAALAAEFERPLRGLTITQLADPDTYAAEVGLPRRLPGGRRSRQLGRAWLVHCYGMVGAGRDNDVDSGGGTELYVVIGQAPRHLDRNVTLLGRVVQGMELLSVMPRGTGALGFYEHPEQRMPIKSHARGRRRAAGAAHRARGAAHRHPDVCRLRRRARATGARNGSRCRPGTWTSATCRCRCAPAPRPRRSPSAAPATLQ